MRIIHITPSAVERLCESWPCHNLDGVDHVMIATDDDGNLVDLDLFDDECRPLDHQTHDGPALLALIADATAHAVKVPDHPKMIDRGWIYS